MPESRAVMPLVPLSSYVMQPLDTWASEAHFVDEHVPAAAQTLELLPRLGATQRSFRNWAVGTARLRMT